MYLRKLELHDAPLMLEWMHDPEISRFFRADFASMTLHDAENFIAHSTKLTPDNSINAAVSSDDGTYMGTVSLKHINFLRGNAEFAIVMRRAAHGQGFAWYGMREIIAGAFRDLKLSLVWWNVLRVNHRAVRFYEKHNFSEMMSVPDEFTRYYEDTQKFRWYSVVSPMTDENSKFIMATGNRQQATGLLCLY